MGLLLTIIGLITVTAATGTSDASAVQIIQVYAEGLFYAVIVIGIGVGIYVGTRAND